MEGAELFVLLDGTAPPHTIGEGRFVQVDCARSHSVALCDDGSVCSWGRGALGVLGHGDESDVEMPRRISALLRVRIASIACGPYHSAAIDTRGRLFSWGWALEAPEVVGARPTETYVASPCRLLEWRGPSELAAFVGVACGCYATAAWDAAERLYTWGDGSSGQLGLVGCASVATPKRVEAGSAVVGAAFGGLARARAHSGFLLVRTRDGLLSCGDPADGKLGRPSSVDGKGDGVPHSQLGAVEFGTGGGWLDLACQRGVHVTHAAAADSHAAAVTSDGALHTWGALHVRGADGRLALGVVRRPLSVGDLGGMKIRALACSGASTTVLTTDGVVYLVGAAHGDEQCSRLALPRPAAALVGGGGAYAALVPSAGSATPARPASPNGALAAAFKSAGSALGLDARELLDAVPAELAEWLLADVSGAPTAQLAGELQVLRELHAAETAKLQRLLAAAQH